MAKKTALGKAPPKPRTADEFVAAGSENLGQRLVRSAEEAVEMVKMKRLTLDVPESLHKRIKRTCADRGEMMADVLREILEKEFPA
ncbi:plasmid partition protein ParG [Microvirga mediterraneensis]|uniref:ParG protein n=1 Tax=Microvirga mediterraneensis TaxID=2754695 RepID=A0A838BWV1_9HYPH|nr:plasmid partition protein ParG [Microvirga mediterraneensis]MBA1159345.1 hypothetical protein [Microvirga mediterraneensis]